MDFDSLEDASAATVRFERELEELVVGSFTRSVPVEGTRAVASPLEEAAEGGRPDLDLAVEDERR